jgi:hypothetical protein
MARAGYTAASPSCALTAATAKTVLTVLAPATFGVDLIGFELSLDGSTSTAVPVLWELCSLDGSTAGTSTAGTVRQESGRVITAGFTTGGNFTAEPTALTVLYNDFIPAFNGLAFRDFPFLSGPDSAVSQGFALRLTAPAAVNARASFRFARA